jgi:hypothetical protein
VSADPYAQGPPPGCAGPYIIVDFQIDSLTHKNMPNSDKPLREAPNEPLNSVWRNWHARGRFPVREEKPNQVDFVYQTAASFAQDARK